MFRSSPSFHSPSPYGLVPFGGIGESEGFRSIPGAVGGGVGWDMLSDPSEGNLDQGDAAEASTRR